MRSMRLSDSLCKNQLWNGQVTITLLEGRNIPLEGLAEAFILLKLGDQRYKSKVSTQNFLQFGTILDFFFFNISEIKSRRPVQRCLLMFTIYSNAEIRKLGALYLFLCI